MLFKVADFSDFETTLQLRTGLLADHARICWIFRVFNLPQPFRKGTRRTALHDNRALQRLVGSAEAWTKTKAEAGRGGEAFCGI